MKTNKTGKWRVKRLSLRLGRSRRAEIRLRRFRTAPNRRSARYRQVVFNPNLLSIREISLAWIKTGTKRKPLKQSRAPIPYFAPVLLIAFGISGILTFAPHIQQPAHLDLVGPKRAVAAVVPAEPPKTLSLSRSEPVRLQIPSIAIDTQLVPVGLQPSGAIAMPGPDMAGWYDQSPTPGEIGPSVIVGHVDKIGGIAVFWRLRELAPGDTFSITRQDGSTANFTVSDVRQLPQDSFPSQEVYGNIDYAGVRLITCGGVFNEQTGHYSDNTVIYGRLKL